MHNINFILADIDRLKDKKSLESLIRNWNSLSFNKSKSFTSISQMIMDTYKGSNCISEKDIQQLALSMKNTFLCNREDGMDSEAALIESCYISNPSTDKEKVINESFLSILSEAIQSNKKILSIKNNHIKLNNKINIDKYISDNNLIYNESNAIEGVYDLCELIESTYPDITSKQKVTVCAENIPYAYKMSRCSIPDTKILESILDYFLLKEGYSLSMLEDVLIDPDSSDKSKIKNKIDLLKKKKKDSDEPCILLELDKDPIKVFLTKLLLDIKDSTTYNKSKSIADSIVKKLYKVKKEDIIEELPHIIGFIRRVILYGGSLAVSPYLTIPVIIIDMLIHHKVNKSECEKILKALKKERDITNDKLEKAKSDSKDELNKYLNNIEIQIDRVELYMRNLNSELENDKIDDIDINFEMARILAIEESLEPGTHIKENAAVTILRTAREKITKGLDKASATEKNASKTLDRNIEKLQQDIASSVAIKERDRVIKGKILPSASKTIKLGIATGAAYMISPVVAVIGALGALAVAKTANARERQLILDEIDVHLKIVEKKISQAEMNNDLKSMENLLKIENKLQREKQRIKYRMKVYYNQNV